MSSAILVQGFFDGACEPTNPGGNIGMGAVIRVVKDGEEVMKKEKAGYVPRSRENTNNVAEYLALGMLVKEMIEVGENLVASGLADHRADVVFSIWGDSKLVVEQMNGRWGVKKGAYVKYYREVKELIGELLKWGEVKIKWVSRWDNEEADRLSRKGIMEEGEHEEEEWIGERGEKGWLMKLMEAVMNMDKVREEVMELNKEDVEEIHQRFTAEIGEEAAARLIENVLCYVGVDTIE